MRTAGITPALPLVGAVTTRPNAAFSSFTARANRLTQFSVSVNVHFFERMASIQEPASVILPMGRSDWLIFGTATNYIQSSGNMPSVRHPRNTQSIIADQSRQTIVDLPFVAPGQFVLPNKLGDRKPVFAAVAKQIGSRFDRPRQNHRVRGRRRLSFLDHKTPAHRIIRLDIPEPSSSTAVKVNPLG